MYGVSKINIEPSLMMISVKDVEFKGNSLARYLQIFAARVRPMAPPSISALPLPAVIFRW